MKTLPLLPPATPFDLSVQRSLQLLQVPDAGGVRPTVGLETGQSFFDTHLGKPVWWRGDHWVDATGTVA